MPKANRYSGKLFRPKWILGKLFRPKGILGNYSHKMGFLFLSSAVLVVKKKSYMDSISDRELKLLRCMRQIRHVNMQVILRLLTRNKNVHSVHFLFLSPFRQQHEMSDGEWSEFVDYAKSKSLELDDIYFLMNRKKRDANIADNARQQVATQMKKTQKSI